MKHQINLILTAVLCVCILAVSTVSVMATEPDGDATVLTSSEFVPSDVVNDTSSESSSVDNDSSEDTPSNSSSDSTSSDETSSDENSSDETTSDETASGDTSSSDTTSKRPITSEGAGAGDTFIDETGSLVTGSGTVSDTSVPGGLIGTESTVEPEDDGNHFTGETTTAAAAVMKVIWIPILMIFVCVVGLIYINVFVKPKYEPITKKETSKVVRRRKK